MYYWFNKFMKWTGLSHSTSFHVRIFGLVINRFFLSITIGSVGFATSHYGYVAVEKRPADILVMSVGLAVMFGAYRIMRPWLQSGKLSHR